MDFPTCSLYDYIKQIWIQVLWLNILQARKSYFCKSYKGKDT